MKNLSLTKWVLTAGVAAFVATAQAQDSANVNSTTVATPAPTATVSTPATAAPPVLAESVSGVLQLSQAKVSDNTILSFIQNSTTSYPMVASQIIYLKQQGVSDAVLNAMINHPGFAPSSAPATTAPMTSDSTSVSTPNATVAPTYETVPSSSVYVVPDTQTIEYDNWYYGGYPYYGYPYYYAPVGVSIGLGWGWHGGYGGWHGCGGWHGGGGFHGGWHH